MRLLSILFPIIFSYQTMAHEGHQAFYQLSEDNGTLVLVAKLEMPDIKSCLAREARCAKDQDFNWCAGSWIVDNVSVKIDDKMRSLSLESSYTEDGHLVLRFSLGDCPEMISSISVTNTCFLASFPRYENVFQVEINRKKQGYKMNKERTNININLKTKK